MKKITNTLFLLLMLLLLFITRNSNIFALTYSFSIYLLYMGLFKTIKVGEDTDYKMFKWVNIMVGLLGILFLALSYFLGDVILGYQLGMVNMMMTLCFFSRLFLRIICDYISSHGYKKLFYNLVGICDIVSLILNIILSILLFKVFKIDDYIKIVILYGISFFIYFITFGILNIFIYKKRKLRTNLKNKISFNEIKKIIISDKKEVICRIYNYAYIYISIVILYFTLINKFNYEFIDTCIIISNTFFYGVIIFYYLYEILKGYLDIDYDNIKDNFMININKIIYLSLTTGILLITISSSCNYLLFSSDYNFVIAIGSILFIYPLYDYVIKCIMLYSSEKKLFLILGIGLIIKCVFEFPLINAIYRMGYALNLGSVFSIILAMILDIIMGIIIIKSKFKINLLKNFTKILDIIYDSIIYALVITLFALIIKVDTNSYSSSLFVIFFYIGISILYIVIRRIIKKK